MTSWRIVCDIGGTNIRLARADEARQISGLRVVPAGTCNAPAKTFLDFANAFEDGERLAGVAIAAAGPVDGPIVRLTNRALTIDAREISAVLGGVPVVVLNDLEAVAWALSWTDPSELHPILAPSDPLQGPRLVVNIGTGFGGALLIETSAGWHVVPCEPGHMRLATPGPPFALASVEELLSGLALGDRACLARHWNVHLPRKGDAGAHDTFERILATADGADFMRRFSGMLGHVCGDLVLACGAWGGVHLCGSVAAAWLRRADRAAFQAAFVAKGPMSARMARVNVAQINTPYPALTGLAALPLR